MLSFVFLGVSFGVLITNIDQRLHSSKQNGVMQLADRVHEFIMEGSDAVRLSAYQIGIMMGENASDDEIQGYLVDNTQSYRKVIDPNYSVLYGSFRGKFMTGNGWIPAADYVPETRPWYREALDSSYDVTLVEPYLDVQTGTVMISLSKSLRDQKSVVALDVSLDGIRKMIKEYAADDEFESAMVLTADSFVVAHSDRTKLGKTLANEEDTFERALWDLVSKEDMGAFRFEYGGQTFLVITEAIEQGWKVVSVTDPTEIKKIVRPYLYAFFADIVIISTALYSVFWNFRIKKRKRDMLNRQLISVSKLYSSVFRIDLEKDLYFDVSYDEENGKLKGEGRKDAQLNIRMIMDEMTEERFKKAIFDFIDLKTLDERLEGKNSIIREFINDRNERCCLRFAPLSRNEDGSLKSVILLMEKYE